MQICIEMTSYNFLLTVCLLLLLQIQLLSNAFHLFTLLLLFLNVLTQLENTRGDVVKTALCVSNRTDGLTEEKTCLNHFVKVILGLFPLFDFMHSGLLHVLLLACKLHDSPVLSLHLFLLHASPLSLLLFELFNELLGSFDLL